MGGWRVGGRVSGGWVEGGRDNAVLDSSKDTPQLFKDTRHCAYTWGQRCVVSAPPVQIMGWWVPESTMLPRTDAAYAQRSHPYITLEIRTLC
jgi:hypothetical protein